jgi:hypothetical protein
MKKRTFKAYICSKDAIYHIPDDWDGINIYFSEESIKEHRKCVRDTKHGCKIVEITIKLPKDIEDGTWD